MDKEFVETLYEKYLESLLKYCEILMRFDPKYTQQAEDIVHDVFIVAIQKQEMLSRHPNPYGWLARTCRNKCYTLLRKDLHRKEIVGQPVEYDDGISMASQQDAIINLLYRLDAEIFLSDLYSKLSPMEKQVFPVYFVEHKSLKETSAELGIKVDALNSAVGRIRKKALRMNWLSLFVYVTPVLAFLRDILFERGY